MQDLFSKVSLGVIAVSLVVIAGLDVLQASAEFERQSDEHMNEILSCDIDMANLQDAIVTLQEQIKTVPAKVEDVPGDPSTAHTNRLYEVLMANIIESRTRLKATEVRCAELQER